MKTRLIKSAALAAALLIASGSFTSAFAGDVVEQREARAKYKVLDLLVVRPIGLVMTIAGTGLFVATLPVTAISGDVEDAGEVLVKTPAKMAFSRR